MHFRTHVRPEHRHKGNDEYADGMIEHDGHVGELLKLLDDLGIANDTIVFYSTERSAPQHLAGRRHHAVPQREELELGGRLPRSGFRPPARPLPGEHDVERPIRGGRGISDRAPGTKCRPSAKLRLFG